MYYYIYHFLSYTYIMSSFMSWLHAHTILFIYLSLFSTFYTLLVPILFVCYTLCFLYTVFMYCSFHILFSCYTFHMIVIYCAFPLILSYTIISYDIHILCFSYTVILYFTSCSCNCLYFHRIAVLCFSYHVISYTFHIHLYVLILSIIYFVLSYTFCALEVPVGTTERNQRYIQIFTFILYSESYHISV